MPEYRKAEDYILNRLKTELSPTLYYHGYHHTDDVMKAASEIAQAEGISDDDLKLLRVAVAFHDAGFIYIYNNHELKGCEMAREALPGFGFSENEISTICGMIMATKIPQQPTNLLEEIIADADLDYLGREDADQIAHTLFNELQHQANVGNESEWNNLQVKFLNSHRYFTKYSNAVRAPVKQQYLDKLIQQSELSF